MREGEGSERGQQCCLSLSLLTWLLLSSLQALDQVSRFLGYPATTGFLGDHLLHMMSSWLDKGQSLTDFPHQLLGDKTREHFFQ